MTTIYEMASGTEYLGDELSSPEPVVVKTPTASAPLCEYQYELGLGLREHTPSTEASKLCPVVLDMKALLDKLED